MICYKRMGPDPCPKCKCSTHFVVGTAIYEEGVACDNKRCGWNHIPRRKKPLDR